MRQGNLYRGHFAFGVSVIVLTLVLAAAPARGETVAITGGQGNSLVNGGTLANGGSKVRAPANPTAATDMASYNFQASTTSYALGNDGFGIGMTHSRIGVTDQYAQSWGRIFFAIAPDAPGALLSYTAAGNYTVTDGLPNAPGEVYFQSFLFDQTANTYLYLSAQRSYRTGNESFTLGGSGGDNSNTFTGSLTGSLTAGHSYEWYYNAYTKTFGFPWGASATGNFSLTFNETTPPVAPVVPLPAAAWGGLALMGMLGAKRAVRRNREDAAV